MAALSNDNYGEANPSQAPFLTGLRRPGED